MQTDKYIPLPDSAGELTELHDAIVCKLALFNVQAYETEQVISEMDSADIDAAYERYKQKNSGQTERVILREVKNASKKYSAKRIALRAIQAAAAVIAILSIGLTTAIATVPEVRVSVLTLLMDVQKQYTEIRLVENEDLSFFVPQDWKGDYFPSYIPPQFTFEKTEDLGRSIATFFDASDHLLEFSEANEDTTMQIDTENAENEFTFMHGSTCLISTKNGSTSIVWMQNDKYFYLYYQGDKSEAVKVAQSVVFLH